MSNSVRAVIAVIGLALVAAYSKSSIGDAERAAGIGSSKFADSEKEKKAPNAYRRGELELISNYTGVPVEQLWEMTRLKVRRVLSEAHERKRLQAEPSRSP